MPPIPSSSASATVSVSVRRARIEFMRRSSRRARDERVAEPALRADDRRMAVHVELAAQAAHRGVDGVARRLAAFVVEARLDLGALHVLAAPQREVLEQHELLARELDRNACALDHAAREVDLERADREHVALHTVAPTAESLD